LRVGIEGLDHALLVPRQQRPAVSFEGLVSASKPTQDSKQPMLGLLQLLPLRQGENGEVLEEVLSTLTVVDACVSEHLFETRQKALEGCEQLGRCLGRQRWSQTVPSHAYPPRG
jgi:hypothetical protein